MPTDRRAAPLPVAGRWFAATPAGDGVTLITEPWVDEFLRSNLWLVTGGERDLLVDSGNGVAPLQPELQALRGDPDKPLVAVATHAHSDHVGGLHEFGERLAHALEAEALATGADAACLVSAQLPADLLAEVAADGYELPDVLLTALPYAGFDPAGFAVTPAAPTATVGEGDTIDLGDRLFTVLHLPGHSPGSIGLWEERSGILFSGDAVYRDSPLLDQMPGSDVGDYLETMARLRELPVATVHGGHDPSFTRPRLLEIAEAYLDRRGPR
jgi:glyoxylase-like metal-dependent hydrolase (beta-lactamase superfamily II)